MNNICLIHWKIYVAPQETYWDAQSNHSDKDQFWGGCRTRVCYSLVVIETLREVNCSVEQRRLFRLKCGRSRIRVKNISIFPGKFPNNFNFFRQFHPIPGKFRKNFNFSGVDFGGQPGRAAPQIWRLPHFSQNICLCPFNIFTSPRQWYSGISCK